MKTIYDKIDLYTQQNIGWIINMEKSLLNKDSYNEYDGEDTDVSWFDELTPEEQEQELSKLKESMFIKEDTDK